VRIPGIGPEIQTSNPARERAAVWALLEGNRSREDPGHSAEREASNPQSGDR